VSTSNEGRLFDFEVTMGALLARVCSQHFLQQAASVLYLLQSLVMSLSTQTLPYILKAQATKHVWCHSWLAAMQEVPVGYYDT